MSLDSDVRHLGTVRPFAALPREALQMLAFSCQKRALRAGERLFAAGDAAGDAYLLLDGEIILRKGATERRAGEGAVVGESALYSATVRATDAYAATDGLALCITGETFRRVLSEFPRSAAALRRAASGRARGWLGAMERVRRRAFA